ncbi:MAG: hypothetical protein BWY72_02310 [Bacteroidetes bacterium ADurb.Bin416]|nr:MAG: hypothetical protein BWY72_02310 [Bacteroidetes bacterium ADurb.Bin416]
MGSSVADSMGSAFTGPLTLVIRLFRLRIESKEKEDDGLREQTGGQHDAGARPVFNLEQGTHNDNGSPDTV